MSIEVRNLNKRFGDFVALDDVNVSLPTGQLTALLGPSGGGKSTLLRIIAGLDSADAGTVSIEGTEATHLPPQKRNVGFVFQHYAVFKHMTVAKNVAFGLEIRKRPKDEIARTGSTSCSSSCTSRSSPTGCPRSSRVGSGSAWRWPARSRSSRRCCSSTSPSVPSTPRCARSCASGCGACTTRCAVTTVFVTHDQEEALEVADEIVVINEGRVEQVGTPDQLYDEPANDFVMGFLGEVTQLGGVTLRPHDIEVDTAPRPSPVPLEGTVSRMLRVGFEVRAHGRPRSTGGEVLVVLTRTHARALDLAEAERVWLTAATGAITVPAMKPQVPAAMVAV